MHKQSGPTTAPYPLSVGAWAGDAAYRDQIIAALEADLANDRYVRGTYGILEEDIFLRAGETERWRGCHVGCVVMADLRLKGDVSQWQLDRLNGGPFGDGHWHEAVSTALTVPLEIPRLWDLVYERMPEQDAPRFAVESLRALPVGANTYLLLPRLLSALLDVDLCIPADHDCCRVEEQAVKAVFTSALLTLDGSDQLDFLEFLKELKPHSHASPFLKAVAAQQLVDAVERWGKQGDDWAPRFGQIATKIVELTARLPQMPAQP